MTGTRRGSTSLTGAAATLRSRLTTLPRRATRSLPRPRWTLRRRLVALVVALVAVVAVAIGGLTTLALRGSLVAQLDDDLQGAHNRFMMWSDDGPVGAGAASGGGDVVLHRVPTEAPPAGLPGQEVGTVTFAVEPGQTAADVTAAYLLRSGEQRVVPTEAVAALLDLPHDGQIREVDLAGIGEYRALVSVTRGGDVAVTAMPTASVTSTITTYMLMVGVVALLAVLAAAAAGLVLVRRELRPLTRVAATAARVSRLPLDRGEVVLADRVPAADTDTATEVGSVGAALNRLLGHVEGALAARHASESQVRQFVADASHELRTPLASIRGYAELVRRLPDDLPPEALVAMARVESESQRMTALVEDMLLLARLDAGRPLETEPVDLAMLAVDAVTDAHAAGPDHTWSLDLSGLPDDESADDPGAVVVGDDHRLRQVLANLLSNARLHTPAGTSVSVRVARRGSDCVLDVVDDGPGIPADLRDRLFERFVRGDASRNRAAGSTGLGLSIAHAVVTAHGGTLTVSATPGGGTTFTVRLPSAPPDDAPSRVPHAPALVDA
ncbi:two-component sensor histidine kinase [Cellulomonas algicola]|uniref:histidine kinase n=1 Tax=Cellulomonas algicola TaxID=2071633 RepID=A0A401V185_9CELL|nr:HAMP domain-containing sensor histidine kinase [Cellulomonas algicola]GCD20670.1 two-component sensor histidine kinase [Cellulomonas algicola]